jgi:hypothetical protein
VICVWRRWWVVWWCEGVWFLLCREEALRAAAVEEVAAAEEAARLAAEEEAAERSEAQAEAAALQAAQDEKESTNARLAADAEALEAEEEEERCVLLYFLPLLLPSFPSFTASTASCSTSLTLLQRRRNEIDSNTHSLENFQPISCLGVQSSLHVYFAYAPVNKMTRRIPSARVASSSSFISGCSSKGDIRSPVTLPLPFQFSPPRVACLFPRPSANTQLSEIVLSPTVEIRICPGISNC